MYAFGSSYDPWAMFHSTDMGDHLEEVVDTGDRKVLRMKGPSGDGLIPIYQVFDGVYLIPITFPFLAVPKCERSVCTQWCVSLIPGERL